MSEHGVDVLVVGAGVAGAAVAESLARSQGIDVMVVESDRTPGLHSSGRSVAVFDPLYGDDAVRRLSAVSRPLLDDGLDGSGISLLTPRPLVLVARPEQRERMAQAYPPGTAGITRLAEDEVRSLFPALRPGVIDSAVMHTGGADLDVARLHDGLLARARRAGARVLVDHPVSSVRPQDDHRWVVTAGDQVVRAGVVVNAAGAWADHVAGLAGARPLGVVPLRRSVAATRSDRPDSARWAMLVDVDMEWYLKPDGGTFLLSPADAVPVEPGDPRPDELELARAIDAVNDATTLGVRSVIRTWAGLRSYVADQRPLIGFDAQVPGLFWHGAFGGFGLQVAPAAGMLAAALITGAQPAVDPLPYSPIRLDASGGSA